MKPIRAVLRDGRGRCLPGYTPEERILDMTTEDDDSGCWICHYAGTYGNSSTPYPVIKIDGRTHRVARIAYELWVAPIPQGMQIDHVAARGCTSTRCINPEHLEAVTPRENTLRGNSLQSKNAVKTHCIRGHEFSEENTYRQWNGCRGCRTCRAEYQRAYTVRRRMA